MKNLFVFLAMISGTVMASNYECVTKENVVVTVSPMEVGGMISTRDEAGVVSDLGKVGEIDSYVKNDGTTGEAFEFLLGIVEAFEVTDLSSEELEKVTSISSIVTDESAETEVMMFRLFTGEKEVGGVFISDGSETYCNVK